MSDFNIASLNVNGAGEKRLQLYETMNLKVIDVMFIQETVTGYRELTRGQSEMVT